MSARVGPPSARRIGAVLLVLLVPLAAAGYVLALGYDADPLRAHDAVAAMSDGIKGWLRGVHAWAATAVLVAALLHAARAYAEGAAPVAHRGRWLTGVALLGLLTGAFLTGTILVWDQQGWEALEHVQSVGPEVAAEPGEAPLRLLFLGHIFALPVALGALLALHWRRPDASHRVLARLKGLVLRRTTARAAGTIALTLAALAAIAPPALGPAPIAGLSLTRPDWPFLWLVPLQDAFGPAALWALPLAFALLAALPWLTRRGQGRTRALIVVAALALWLALTVLGV